MRSLLILLIALQSVLPRTSEKLVYEVRYKLGALNTKVATGTIPLVPDVWEGRKALRSDASIKVQPFFKLFLKGSYTANLYLGAGDMKPLFYRYGHENGFNECRYRADSVYFHRSHKKKGVQNIALSNDGRTMEIFSMLFLLRELNLSPGESINAKAYLSGGFRNVRITMIGTDAERYPGREADAFLIETPEQGLMENGSGTVIRLWRSHGGTRPVLGIEVPLSTGTMIANLTNEL